MSQYIVSARKYRPTSFETLIGQDNIARTLKNSILRGQLAHAYLFCGPRGVGKTSAARIFAKTINCLNPGPDMEPCGECESCRSFIEGRSFCIHELDAASNNGIDDMKALIDQVRIPPQIGKYSVFIIDEVHMLTTSAFNAFLKTLEEPPAHAVFILATTEKHKIIPTILSRCQTYDFNRIGVEDIVRNLRSIAADQQVRIDDESLHIIAQKADGAMRDALTIFDQTVAFCGQEIQYADVIRNLNVLDYEYGFRLVDAFLAKDYKTALLVFDEILSKGFNDLHFVSAVGSHLRDLLVSRTGGMDSLLNLPASLKARYREQGSRCSVKFIFDALGVIAQCEAGYRAATNQRLHIEYALMRLCFLAGLPVSGNIPTAPPARPAAVPATASAAADPVPAAAPTAQVAVSPHVAAPSPSAQAGVKAAQATETGGTSLPGDGSAVDGPERFEKGQAGVSGEGSYVPEKERNEEAAKAEPRKPRGARKTASGLSLASLMNGEEEMVVAPVETAGEKAATKALPGIDEVGRGWQELCTMYASQPRLASALAAAKLSIREGEGYETVQFQVVNEAQKRWIEERILRDMEGKFQKILSSAGVRLEACVIPEEEQETKVYMPSEKAKVMIENNENVKNLVVELGLDVR